MFYQLRVAFVFFLRIFPCRFLIGSRSIVLFDLWYRSLSPSVHVFSLFPLAAVQVCLERVQPDPTEEVQGVSGIRQDSQDDRQALQLLGRRPI